MFVKINVTAKDIEWARGMESFPVTPGAVRRFHRYMGDIGPDGEPNGSNENFVREFGFYKDEEDGSVRPWITMLGNDDRWHSFVMDAAGESLIRQWHQEMWNPEYPTLCPEWNTGAGPMEPCIVGVEMPYANWLEDQAA